MNCVNQMKSDSRRGWLIPPSVNRFDTLVWSKVLSCLDRKDIQSTVIACTPSTRNKNEEQLNVLRSNVLAAAQCVEDKDWSELLKEIGKHLQDGPLARAFEANGLRLKTPEEETEITSPESLKNVAQDLLSREMKAIYIIRMLDRTTLQSIDQRLIDIFEQKGRPYVLVSVPESFTESLREPLLLCQLRSADRIKQELQRENLHKDRTLHTMMPRAIHYDQITLAMDFLTSIKDVQIKNDAIFAFGRALSDEFPVWSLLRTVRDHSDPVGRDLVFCNSAFSQLESSNDDKAVEISARIFDPIRRYRALLDVALAIAPEENEDLYKTVAIAHFAHRYLRAGYIADVLELCEKISLGSAANRETRNSILCQTIEPLIKTGQLEIALLIMESIPLSERKEFGLRSIVRALLQADDPTRAMPYFSQWIPRAVSVFRTYDPFSQDMYTRYGIHPELILDRRSPDSMHAILKMVTTLIQENKLEQMLTMIDQMPEEMDKKLVLHNIRYALVKERRIEQALELTRRIPDPKERDAAFALIAKTVAKIHPELGTEEIIRNISDQWVQAATLLEINALLRQRAVSLQTQRVVYL